MGSPLEDRNVTAGQPSPWGEPSLGDPDGAFLSTGFNRALSTDEEPAIRGLQLRQSDRKKPHGKSYTTKPR